MIIYAAFILFFISFCQFLYIRKIRRQAAEWLSDLKEVKNNPCQKMFIRGMGIFADINYELNDILEENRKKLMQFQKADAANKRIMTSLSHDVRTPLASLIGYLEALNQNNGENTREYIEISYKKALSLKTVIDILFEWCKINSNEQQYHLEPRDINELSREIIIGWLPLLNQKKISLNVNIPDEEWIIALDQSAYKRAVDNLVQNAVSHGNCTRIAIDILEKEGKISVVVLNDGAVIPKEKLPFIFDRLYKCDPSRSEAGTGLGLSISKELITSMKGTIGAASSPKDGTAFTIEFSPWS